MKQFARLFAGQVVGLLILLFLLIFQLPTPLEITYPALQLKNLDGGTTGNFYQAESDPSGNRYSWAKADALLNLDLATMHGFKLTVEGRSAAVYGGPDAPIQVRVNDQTVGQFHFDPANPNFQKVTLAYTGASSQNLKIELVTTPYQPKGEPRTLGFMVKNVQLTNLDWPNQPLRLRLLAGLMFALLIVTIALGWWNHQRGHRKQSKLVGYALLGLNLIGSSAVLATVFLLGRFASWLTDSGKFLLWTVGLGLLAIIFWQGTAFQPVGETGHSLYRRAFRRLKLQRLERTAAIPFKGVASIEALTGLRAIAAIMVFSYHYPLTENSGLPQWLFSFTRSGNNGVPLFFTLSGFVICYNYYARLTTRPFRNLWPFLVNRFARLYPVYLLVFAVALVQTYFSQPDHLKVPVLWQQAAMLQTWNPDVRVLSALTYNVPSWSVNVEIFLYVCFPLVAWLLLTKFQKVGQLVAIAVVAMLAVLILAAEFLLSGNTQPANYSVDTPGLYIFFYLPVTHLSEFISGCAAARIYVLLANKPVSARELAWGRGALVVAIAAVVFLMIFDQPYMVPFRFASGYVPFFTIVVFCLARYRTLLSRFLSTKLLVLLGEASYSFYMWHEVVLINNIGPLTTIAKPWSYLLGFGLFLVTVVISVASFKLIETPSRKLIRRLALSRRANASASSPTNSPKVEVNA